jgi:biopolymer transport protein ExbB
MEDYIIGALILTSIVGLSFIVERGLALRWGKVIPPGVESALENCRTGEDVATLKQVCLGQPSPLGRLLVVAVEHLDWTREEAVDALQTRARHEVVKLERGLIILEIIVGIGPLLGLTGTIFGMIKLFGGLGEVGLGDSSKFADGISTVLVATLLGLLVAIPSLIAWSYYNRKVERMAVEMATFCDDFLRRQYRLRRNTIGGKAS